VSTVTKLVIVSGRKLADGLDWTRNHQRGTSRTEDLLLDDVSVSRHHALFTRTASDAYAARLELTKWHLRQREGASEETTLHSGGRVQIGKIQIGVLGFHAMDHQGNMRIGEVHAILRRDRTGHPSCPRSATTRTKGLVQPTEAARATVSTPARRGLSA